MPGVDTSSRHLRVDVGRFGSKVEENPSSAITLVSYLRCLLSLAIGSERVDGARLCPPVVEARRSAEDLPGKRKPVIGSVTCLVRVVCDSHAPDFDNPCDRLHAMIRTNATLAS